MLTIEQNKTIKSEAEALILGYEAELKELDNLVSHGLNIPKMATLLTSNLQDVHSLYVNANITGKRIIVNAFYKQRWVFDGVEHRTGKLNEATDLIHQLNNKLQHKKTRVKTSKSYYSGTVPSAGVEPLTDW
ncbi:hypothetical protein [Pedobacter steynii]